LFTSESQFHKTLPFEGSPITIDIWNLIVPEYARCPNLLITYVEMDDITKFMEPEIWTYKNNTGTQLTEHLQIEVPKHEKYVGNHTVQIWAVLTHTEDEYAFFSN
jgi:hypothetical protein